MHQPNYLPYLGIFHKIAWSELFVFYDNVPFPQGKTWISRNRINGRNEPMWLTVPVTKSERSGQLIKDVEIQWRTPWPRKHIGSLRSGYAGSPWLNDVCDLLDSRFARQPEKLAELNVGIIQDLCDFIGIKRQFAMASDRVDGDERGMEMIRSVLLEFDCDEYLTGTGYSEFDPTLLNTAGIRWQAQDFKEPSYESIAGENMPNLSILDALLSCGPDSVRSWLTNNPPVNLQ